jgi:hypothetical protein
MSGRPRAGVENLTSCPQPPVISPDATTNRAEQAAGSAIMNSIYEYEQASGKNYRFLDNHTRLLFKMGKIRQGNILADPVKYANAPAQSTITDINTLRNL